MPISRRDIERACDHFDRANGRVANHGGERIKKWLREQGLSFWDKQFHRLYGQVLQDRMPLTKDDGVQVRVQTSNEATVLPENELPLFGGRFHTPDNYRRHLRGKRFFCTTAQNNTMLHDAAWATLLRFADDTNTQILVSQFSYNKKGWQQITVETEGLWYDKRIIPYLIEEQVKLADDLVFCAELDILPTAVTPLTGLDNYTGHNSAIIPHTKMQMKSLATMKDHPAKLMYSTGAITLRNYIQRRAGQIAEYHHIFGGILVEVDDEGNWFCRQINFNEDGSFTDLSEHWTKDGRQEAQAPIVNLADIHAEKMDPVAWAGAKRMLTNLQARIVVCHDTLDFTTRNHHNKRDPFFVAEQEFWRNSTVEDDVKAAARVMEEIANLLPDAMILNIRSNHDQALLQWLREGSTFTDPRNLRYWHSLNAAVFEAIERGDVSFDIYEYAMSKTGCDLTNVAFVREDQSVVLEGIEFGMHGHLGANGARGNPRQYRQLGRRANTGHTHSAGIIDGVWTSGVMALDMGYNKGLSSWSVSHILTHAGGKRQIVTQRGDKYRA